MFFYQYADDITSNVITSRPLRFDSKRGVYIDTPMAPHQTISCGVPLGSIMGPLLFYFYLINRYNMFFYQYTDDTTSCYRVVSAEGLFGVR